MSFERFENKITRFPLFIIKVKQVSRVKSCLLKLSHILKNMSLFLLLEDKQENCKLFLAVTSIEFFLIVAVKSLSHNIFNVS